MNRAKAALAYKKTHVQSSPIRVLDALLRRLINDLSDARQAIQSGDIKGKSKATDHALAILTELNAALDRTLAPELCENLASLYHFTKERVLEASVQMSAGPLDAAESVINTIQRSFAEAGGI